MQQTTNPYLTKKELYEELFSIMERLSPNGETRHMHAEIESMLTSLFNNSKDAMKRMNAIRQNQKKGIVPASAAKLMPVAQTTETSNDNAAAVSQTQQTANVVPEKKYSNRKYDQTSYNKSIGEEIEKKTALSVDESKNEHLEVIAEDQIQKIIEKNKLKNQQRKPEGIITTKDQEFDQQEETGYSKMFDLYNKGVESAQEEFGDVQSFIDHIASLGAEIAGDSWSNAWLNFEKKMN